MSGFNGSNGSTSTRRGTLTDSPLGRPRQLIHALAAEVQEYLYYPDPQPLYLMLGTVAANMMKGAPVWIMMIGAPSSGRTALLDMIVDVPRVHLADSITGPSALLSGTSSKERAKNASGGLLNRIGPRGLIVMEDFTNVLSMAHEPMKETIGAFRRIFDGRWTREVGSDGGRTLAWCMPPKDKGRLGFLGACTPKIDAHHTLIQELGQRWLYYRFPPMDGLPEANAALGHVDMEAMDRRLRWLVAGFFDALGLEWDNVEPRVLEAGEKTKLTAMAGLMTTVRTAVSRDFRSKEIDAAVAPEGTMRMAKCLKQLYLGLEQVGLDAAERWKVVAKTALDSAPQLRIRILEGLWNGEMAVEDLRGVLQCGKKTMAGLVGGGSESGDLEVLGVVERQEVGRAEDARVRLTVWAEKMLERGWGRRKGE